MSKWPVQVGSTSVTFRGHMCHQLGHMCHLLGIVGMSKTVSESEKVTHVRKYGRYSRKVTHGDTCGKELKSCPEQLSPSVISSWNHQTTVTFLVTDDRW